MVAIISAVWRRLARAVVMGAVATTVLLTFGVVYFARTYSIGRTDLDST